MASWEPFAVAAVAPIVVWVLWRLQTVGVDLLRRALLLLAGRWHLSWLYAIVSWFGTFLHEVSHATVLLLSGHGVKEFRAGVEEGHVRPGRMKGGAGMLFFLAAALAPLYIPPLLALLAMWLVLHALPLRFAVAGAGFGGVWDAVRPVLVELPQRLGLLIAKLDLADWRQAIVLAVVLLGAPGSRPSHLKSRFHSQGDGGDVAALRRHIRHHPLPFLLFIGVVYGGYFAARWLPQAYWFPLEAVWAVAVTGLVLALVGAAVWTLVGWGSWIGLAAAVAVEVGGRFLHGMSVLQLNAVALAVWAGVAVAWRLLRRS